VLEQTEYEPKEKRIVETDAEGRFRLADSPFKSARLLVAHEAGFAYVAGNEFQKNPERVCEKPGQPGVW
jgi:hypothetical protein